MEVTFWDFLNIYSILPTFSLNSKLYIMYQLFLILVSYAEQSHRMQIEEAPQQQQPEGRLSSFGELTNYLKKDVYNHLSRCSSRTEETFG